MTVMTGSRTHSTVARWAGGLYLAYILANVLASRVGHIGLSDTQTLRATITGDEAMFRWGLVAALSSALLYVITAWALCYAAAPDRRAAGSAPPRPQRCRGGRAVRELSPLSRRPGAGGQRR